MINLKLTIICLLSISFFGLISCNTDNINDHKNNKQLNKTLSDLSKNVTNPRWSRTLFAPLGTNGFAMRRKQPIKLRARADHLPLRSQIRRHNSLHNGQSQPQNIRFGYESLKSSKFMPPSKGANPSFPNNGKGSSYRPQLMGGHPNSIHVPAMSQQYMHNFKASPAFNGQVVVHPVPQKQKQQPTKTQQDNSYPKYVKPPQQQQSTKPAITSQSQPQMQQQQQQQQQHQQQQQQPALTIYPDFKQYPIPDYDKMQQHNEQHEKYLQQQKFLTPKNPIAFYQLQKTQQQHQESQASQPQQNYAVQQALQYLPQSQQQQPSIPLHEGAQNKNMNSISFSAAATNPPKMYSVYEENDMSDMQTNNFQANRYQELEKEAQDYIRFMNSNEYFLPKKEPNYKRIDDETDMRQYNTLKAQTQQRLHPIQQQQPQAPTPYQQLLSQQAAYQQQQVYTPSSLQQRTQYSNSLHSDATDTSAYNQENPVARVYTKHDPPTASSASSTVVRTSYQTGYNQNKYFLNSQDKKTGKYTKVPPTSTPSIVAIPTPSPIAYPQLRHNTPGNRTPEPLRFEFTERDAMVGGYAYTNAPQGQLRYKELTFNSATPIVPHDESSTVHSQNYLNGKHTVKSKVEEGEDDPEDGDDIQEAGINLFGRQPAVNNDAMKQLPSTTETPSNEQRDSEDYCERICAIVEDEDEEIVCGSDGYMYTSEAQMECYASCLHIDVTIQGKGSCSAR